MLDYKLLEALSTVVECGGFERAGEALGISQSAVSQRIRTLEIRLGQPVLVRGQVPKATPVGQRLLNHVQQVRLLEQDLAGALPALTEPATRLRIAVNADSLATWWAATLGDFCREEGILLDLVIEDQDVGLKRMREGDVAACLCQQPAAGSRRPLCATGCHDLSAPGDTGLYTEVFSGGSDRKGITPGPGHCLRPRRPAGSTASWPSLATRGPSPTTSVPPPRALSIWPGRAWATA